MSRPLIVSIPHRFGRQEARRRLDAGVARLRPELGVFLSRLDYHWEDDTLKFIASALWQQITGRIEVLDDAVRVEIDLPWAMQLLRDTIARRVCSRGWLCWIGRPKRSYSSSLHMIMDPDRSRGHKVARCVRGRIHVLTLAPAWSW